MCYLEKLDHALRFIYIYFTLSRNKQTKPKFWQKVKMQILENRNIHVVLGGLTPLLFLNRQYKLSIISQVLCLSFMSFSSFRRLLHSNAFNYLMCWGLPNSENLPDFIYYLQAYVTTYVWNSTISNEIISSISMALLVCLQPPKQPLQSTGVFLSYLRVNFQCLRGFTLFHSLYSNSQQALLQKNFLGSVSFPFPLLLSIFLNSCLGNWRKSTPTF